jgi:hypothetical protein
MPVTAYDMIVEVEGGAGAVDVEHGTLHWPCINLRIVAQHNMFGTLEYWYSGVPRVCVPRTLLHSLHQSTTSWQWTLRLLVEILLNYVLSYTIDQNTVLW